MEKIVVSIQNGLLAEAISQMLILRSTMRMFL